LAFFGVFSVLERLLSWAPSILLVPLIPLAIVVGIATLLLTFVVVGGIAEFVRLQISSSQRGEKRFGSARTVTSPPSVTRAAPSCVAVSPGTGSVCQTYQDRQGDLLWWRKLSGRAFERELARVLKSNGSSVELTPASNDGGVDLVLKRNHDIILIQCKAHKNPVGPSPVRDLYGALMHRQGAKEAWLVTTSSFTRGAISFARGKPIRLKTIEALLKEDS
jgi:hypothetical protein